MLPYFISVVAGVAVHVLLCGIIKKKIKTNDDDKKIAAADDNKKNDEAKESLENNNENSSDKKLFVIGVTACPSGVAHTYMGAEAIKKACEDKGIECKIETQGSIGIENKLTVEDVERATAVILSTNMPIKDVERFDGKFKIENDLSHIIKEADSMIEEVINHK